jgi:hypothetical protein
VAPIFGELAVVIAELRRTIWAVVMNMEGGSARGGSGRGVEESGVKKSSGGGILL